MQLFMKLNKAFLFLEDGTYCHGWTFLNSVFSVGELVFNTGMTGYQEVITDPSYLNQIILFTYPEIGNTGMNFDDMESSRPHIRGLVVRNLSFDSSNWKKKLSLVNYLVSIKIPHFFGIDTRYLAKYIRDSGTMVACITTYKICSSVLAGYARKMFSPKIVDKVTTKISYKYLVDNKPRVLYRDYKIYSTNCSLSVIVVDFGLKTNILRILSAYGCMLTVVPSWESYLSILERKPDGILLTNGPGDPASMVSIVKNVKQLLFTNVPIFGICLGHQVLSLALGATTTKLKFGHRGLNHPVSFSDHVNITSQNHGFIVKNDICLQNKVSISLRNINDHTIAGIVHRSRPYLSVQYHPEASPGPNDSLSIFQHFIHVMKSCR
uniref:Carbamoyl phosphate synthase small chain n=1 Tax=Neogoniolithon spectabile TaxID=231755 RepID=A0A3G3MH50_9FLOR|nr:carbamoyl-phosphate synthase arginine-specific small subunit [Neogoniolithon spectabile]AYR06154.1 carbamoyl-phosphate synthase arginine-specific small subunit [Neogoniolithon spectabile]